jgi:hypothetical protein
MSGDTAMNRPTIDEVRDEPAGMRLDALVHEFIFGKRVPCIHDKVTKVSPNSSLIRCDICGKSFGSTTSALLWRWWPAYSTDPAACAELRRHVIADRRWQYVNVQHYRDRVVVGTVPEPDVESWVEVEEHGTDPIAAECVAWAKVAIIAELRNGVE